MGKRVKKDRTGNKEKKAVQKANKHPSKIVNDEVVSESERKVCAHFEKAIDLAKVISKLESVESNDCEDCRDAAIDCKDGKGKGKRGIKKGSSKATWICLDCGRFSCGGAGLPNSRQTHAVQHARQSRHPLVIRMDNTNLRWCFSCRSLIPADKVDGKGEQKDVLSDIVTLLKKQCSKTMSVDVETNIGDEKSEHGVVAVPNGTDFYAVRGLANLGNTCFFNSVMQNLLAIDMLREYLLTFDRLMGPLTKALKNIFVQTSSKSGVRNVINPQPLFACICARSSQFRGFQQQDSHELLRCLLDELSTEVLRTQKSDSSSHENVASRPASSTFIDAIFGGQISSTVCCLECGHSSVVHEPFLDLSLPLPAEKPPPKKARPSSRTKKSKLPPNRAGKHRPKHNKDTYSRRTVCGFDLSSNSDSSSILKESVLGCSLSTDVESTVMPDKRGLRSRDYSSTSPNNDSRQVSRIGGQEDVVIQPDYPGAVTQSDDQEVGTLSDFIEHVCLSDDQMLSVENKRGLIKQESGSNDMNSDIDLLKNRINSSEDRATAVGDGEKDIETSLLTVVDEDTIDFVGLGDLFDEPKAFAAIGCDPYELDDKDIPVSVESCLAHFVKTELLSGEHAWHCENCSKLQQDGRRIIKNLQKTAPVLHENLSKNEHPCPDAVQPKDQGERYEQEVACYNSGEDEEEDDDDINTGSVNKTMRNATKRILISKSPTVLTIHLKRFGQRTRGRLSKLKSHVAFEEFIDLRPYLDNRYTVRDKCIYRLVGVVEHSGSMTGGHYVAYVRGGDRSEVRSGEENHRVKQTVWYHASDAYVHETSLQEVLRSEAYILFYEKVPL